MNTIKSLRMMAAALLAVIGFAGAANSQAATSWIPKYNGAKHVYVSPGIDNATRSSFDNADAQRQIADLARQQNLDVFVIITQTENDIAGPVSASGPALVRAVWTNWNNHGFQSRRGLIILMTGTGGKLTSVGVRAGESLNSMGINRDAMNDDNGPVRPVLRNYLVNTYDPASVPAAITTNINRLVAASEGNTSSVSPTPAITNVAPVVSTSVSTSPSRNSEPGSSMSIPLLLALTGVVIAAIAIFIMRRRNRDNAPRNVFEDRLRASTRPSSDAPATGGSSNPGTYASSNPGTYPAPVAPASNGSTAGRDAAMIGGGALGGYLLGSEIQRRRDEERRDSSRTTNSDTPYVAPYVAPAASCSTPSAPSSSPASSCSSSTSSSCSSSSSSSCGGGGSSCGGGSS